MSDPCFLCLAPVYYKAVWTRQQAPPIQYNRSPHVHYTARALMSVPVSQKRVWEGNKTSEFTHRTTIKTWFYNEDWLFMSFTEPAASPERKDVWHKQDLNP